MERCQKKKADKSPVELSLEDFKGYYCVGGIDLSKTTDLTAAAVDIEKDGIDYIFAQFWMPLERYKVAIEEEGVPYDIFLQQGFLRISGENQIQYRDVFQWFIDLVRIYKIKPLMTGYDRYSSQYLIQDMKESGFKVDDVYQGTKLAKGGELQEGQAIVAEAGPEILQVVNGKTIVTPLTDGAKNRTLDEALGKRGAGDTKVEMKIENFYNNRKQDIRELTEEVLEVAAQIKERDEAAYA